MEVGGPWAPFRRSGLERPFSPFTASGRTSVRCQKPRSDVAPQPLSGHFCAVPPNTNPHTLSRRFCAVPTHRFASCRSSPQSCAPNYAAGPQLPAQLRGRPTVAPPNCTAGHKPSPTRHQTMQTLPNQRQTSRSGFQISPATPKF